MSSISSSSNSTFPIFSIQSDWYQLIHEFINEPNKTENLNFQFWLNCSWLQSTTDTEPQFSSTQVLIHYNENKQIQLQIINKDDHQERIHTSQDNSSMNHSNFTNTLSTTNGWRVEYFPSTCSSSFCPYLSVHYDSWSVRIQCEFDSFSSFSPFSPFDQIFCADLNAVTERVALGSVSGQLKVVRFNATKLDQTANQTSSMCDLIGHTGDISLVRFFPNPTILLSAAADLTLRIWSLSSGKCVQVLTGHTAAITSITMLDSIRGKYFLTSSHDHTVKLWDCAKTKSIQSYCTYQRTSHHTNNQTNLKPSLSAPVNDLIIINNLPFTPLSSSECQCQLTHNQVSTSTFTTSNLSFSAPDSLTFLLTSTSAVIACEDGSVRVFALSEHASNPVRIFELNSKFSSSPPDPLCCLTSGPTTSTVFVGSELGFINLLCVCCGRVLWRHRRDDAKIYKLHGQVNASESSFHLFSCTSIGAVTEWKFARHSSSYSAELVREFSGADCESVFDLRIDQNILLAASVGKPRIYHLTTVE